MARLGLSFFITMAAMAQPAGHGVISGTVVDRASGDAVRKAVVTLTWQGTPRAWATTRTDGSGKFVFEGLPAGNYDLRAQKQGYGAANYGANSTRELGDLITLGEGETHGGIKLKFQRSATISGRVVDQDGEPAVGVPVNLMRAARSFGERTAQNYGGASTNDKGEYKISVFDAGEFYVRCAPVFQRQMGSGAPIPASQFYGGAKEFKDAKPLRVRGDDALTGIDFHLLMEKPARIMGQVVGVPEMDAPPQGPGPVRMNRGQQVQIQLSSLEPSQNGTFGTGTNSADHRFALADQAPGRYRIEATIRVKDKAYYAVQTVDAHEGDNEVVLALAPAVELHGTLTMEGGKAEGMNVSLMAANMGGRREQHAGTVKKDGTFTIEQMPPGEWTLFVNGIGNNFQKSVKLGDDDLLYKTLEISEKPGLLKIVMSTNTGTVEGEIEAGKRAGILMEPLGKLHDMERFYYSAIVGVDGKFKVMGIAPGKYKIYALEKINTSGFRSPEAVEAIENLGEEIDVQEGGHVKVSPKLVPEETARELLKP